MTEIIKALAGIENTADERWSLYDHLKTAHGVWLTRNEVRRMTVEAFNALHKIHHDEH